MVTCRSLFCPPASLTWAWNYWGMLSQNEVLSLPSPAEDSVEILNGLLVSVKDKMWGNKLKLNKPGAHLVRMMLQSRIAVWECSLCLGGSCSPKCFLPSCGWYVNCTGGPSQVIHPLAMSWFNIVIQCGAALEDLSEMLHGIKYSSSVSLGQNSHDWPSFQLNWLQFVSVSGSKFLLLFLKTYTTWDQDNKGSALSSMYEFPCWLRLGERCEISCQQLPPKCGIPCPLRCGCFPPCWCFDWRPKNWLFKHAFPEFAWLSS